MALAKRKLPLPKGGEKRTGGTEEQRAFVPTITARRHYTRTAANKCFPRPPPSAFAGANRPIPPAPGADTADDCPGHLAFRKGGQASIAMTCGEPAFQRASGLASSQHRGRCVTRRALTREPQAHVEHAYGYREIAQDKHCQCNSSSNESISPSGDQLDYHFHRIKIGAMLLLDILMCYRMKSVVTSVEIM